MSEFDNSGFYPVPANYTDSGRLFGGLCEVRNTVEAVVLVALLGYPELAWLHLALPLKVVVMTVTLLPFQVIEIQEENGKQHPQKSQKTKARRKRTKLAGHQSGQKRCD